MVNFSCQSCGVQCQKVLIVRSNVIPTQHRSTENGMRIIFIWKGVLAWRPFGAQPWNFPIYYTSVKTNFEHSSNIVNGAQESLAETWKRLMYFASLMLQINPLTLARRQNDIIAWIFKGKDSFACFSDQRNWISGWHLIAWKAYIKLHMKDMSRMKLTSHKLGRWHSQLPRLLVSCAQTGPE